MGGSQDDTAAPPLAGSAPLTRMQRVGLVGFMLLFLPLGVAVEMRSAFMNQRMGDLDCFLRAAWAVRSGADLYAVTDDNGFHYNYPPLLAVLLTPLADPPHEPAPAVPATAPLVPYLPFAVSVAIFYAFNLCCLAFAVHTLAGVLDAAPTGSLRWWALRVWPVLVCLVPVGHTLMRGQSNLFVLALMSAAVVAVVRGRSIRGGVCLAAAACLKIYPAFLFLWPLWRRDGRCLAGGAAGFLIGLGLIPLAALGPDRTLECYTRLGSVLVLPALGAGGDDSRADELTNVTATDSQSLLAVLHNNLHFDRATRPDQVSATARTVAYALGGLLTALTLAAFRRPSRDPITVTLFLGLLTLDMLLLCPVCHLHYFALLLPLIAGLVVDRWRRVGTGLGLGTGLTALFVFTAVANLLPHVPSLIVLREGGLATSAALLLWAAGFVALWRRGRSSQAAVQPGGMQAAA